MAEIQPSQIAAVLIDKYPSKEDWGEIVEYAPDDLTEEIANKFLLCCLIDYRSNADDAWARGEKYFKSLSQVERREVWKLIASTPKADWRSEEAFRRCALHWMRPAHNRLWSIANNICMFFDGDARKIWQNGSVFDVFCRLYYIGAGEQISRMIVGALKDSGHISGRGDVKADGHICRVLGRLLAGTEILPVAAVELARRLYPEDLWRLGGPLWSIGSTICRPTSPRCGECVLELHCKFAQSRFVGELKDGAGSLRG
jgi:hypothetical protein